MNSPADVEPRQRLHPLSPLLHGAKSLVVIVAALSWQTLSQVGPGRFVALVAVLVVGAVILSLVSWYNTGYHVVGRELRIHEGLLWRRTRAIPLERLQAVEVVRPLLAQLTGLAELRLEVVGGGKTEAPLAYLTVADAARLRERLLWLAGRIGQPGPAGYAAAGGVVEGAARPERAVHQVSRADLLVSQLLTPQAFLLPFGLLFVVVQFLYEGSWSFIAVASTLTAMAGVLLQPVRRVLDDWDFRLGSDGGTLRVRHGLLETRAQAVPLDRVQAVTVTWPLLWRVKGWLRLRLVVAGYSGAEPDDRNRPDRLLPVGDLPTGQMITAEVLPGVDITGPLTAPPRRARWIRPLSQPVLGAGLADQVFVIRHGLLTRVRVMVPYARIQSVRLVQGPLQRRLRLATVHVDTAGGSGATAHDRDLAEARALAAELVARARVARSRRHDRSGPPTLAAMTQQPDPVFSPGLTARVELTVTDADTAQSVGSGDVPVLGTPRVLALAEAATVAATTAGMPVGTTTVGCRVELEHLAPTPVGRTVTAEARLTKVVERRLLFEVNVSDGESVIAQARIERMLVDRHRFIERASRPS